MPRYQNLKGSMNTFGNNTPVLSSSDRLKNKRDKTIYQAQKQQFQSKRKCGNKNVKYYNNGTIRSIQGYKLQQSLARGNVLCEDCNDRGTLCGSTTRSNFSKIEMGNNLLSEHWGGGGLDASFNVFPTPTFELLQTPGLSVIQSDISGVWGGSAIDISKSLIGPFGELPGSNPPIPMPYGYVNNLIKIPRNLNGNLVAIDSSNVLFPADICANLNHLSRKELFPYMRSSNLKTLIKIRGAVPIHQSVGPTFDYLLTVPGKCTDPSYNLVPGSLLNISTPVGSVFPNIIYTNVLSGEIKSLCCIREQTFTKLTTAKYGIFDMYVELHKISNQQILDTIINTTPSWTPSGWNWDTSFTTSSIANLFNIGFIVHTPDGTELLGSYGDATGFIESVKMIQGLPFYNDQTVGNTTKQGYMSCLEDGTKKINFATDNVNKNTLIKSYCGSKVI